MTNSFYECLALVDALETAECGKNKIAEKELK